jgi:hypothetical protein
VSILSEHSRFFLKSGLLEITDLWTLRVYWEANSECPYAANVVDRNDKNNNGRIQCKRELTYLKR